MTETSPSGGIIVAFSAVIFSLLMLVSATTSASAVGDLPIVQDKIYTIRQFDTVTIDLSSLVTGAFDSIQVNSGTMSPSSYSAVDNVLNYEARDAFPTTHTFSYYARSYAGYSDPGTITVIVEELPIHEVYSDVIVMGMGTSFEIDLANLVSGDWSSISLDGGNPGGTSVLNGTELRYTPYDYFFGTDQIHFTVWDKHWRGVTAVITIEVRPPTPTIILTDLTLVWDVGVYFLESLSSTGGTNPYSYAVISGSLPDGLSISADILSGMPGKEGVFNFTLEATDFNGHKGTKSYKMTIADPDPVPVINFPSVSYNGFVGKYLSEQITGATGGRAPYTYMILGSYPHLPNGLSISDGRIEGIPQNPGFFSLFVLAIDADGYSADQYFQLYIAAAPNIVLPDLSLTGEVGEAFAQAFTASGGAAPYTYTITSGSFPDGLSMSADALQGTPTKDGTFTMAIEATDKDGFTGTKSYTIAIAPKDPVVPLPLLTATNAALSVQFNGAAVTIDLKNHASGTIDTYSITNQPTKGTVALAGSIVSYTPTKDTVGADSFEWSATGPGGTASATVAVAINGGALPVAKDHVLLLNPVQKGIISLVDGATGAPFVKSHLLDNVLADVGTLTLNGNTLAFQPQKAFDGIASISYQLENGFGRSNVAKVEFIVAARPDPSKDPEVTGLLNAQADAARRFADDQTTTITGRLEELHNEPSGERKNSIDWKVGRSSDGSRDPHNEELDSVMVGGSTSSSSPWAVWSSGYVNLANSDNGGTDFSSTAVGATAGIDYRFTPAFVGGVAVGYGQSAAEIGNHGTETSGQAVSAALYGSWHPHGGAFIDGIIGYQRLSFDSTRYVTANGDFAHGSRSGGQVFGALTAGYEFRKDRLTLAPYVGVRGSHGTLNSFSESGGGIYGLSYADQSVTSLSGVAGLRVEKEIETENLLITPSAKVEYRHEFAGNSTTSIGYTGLGTKPYRAEVAGRRKDTLTVSLGVRTRLKKAPGWSIEGTLSSTFGGGKPSHYVGVRATYEFCGLFIPQNACGPQAKTEAVNATGKKPNSAKSRRH